VVTVTVEKNLLHHIFFKNLRWKSTTSGYCTKYFKASFSPYCIPIFLV